MHPLYFDEMACAMIAAQLGKRANTALRVELRPTYHRSGAYFMLAIAWTTVDQAARDTGLVRCTGPHGVPAYVSPRIWRYIMWHPLRIDGNRIGPFKRLLPRITPNFVQDLRRWEDLHPSIELPATSAA